MTTRAEQLAARIWRTREGALIPVGDLTDEHLVNICAWITENVVDEAGDRDSRVQVVIDRSLIDPKRLLDVLLLDSQFGNVDHWRRLVEIVPDYMPPFPRDDRPTIQVRCLVDITEPLPAPGVCTSRYAYLRRGAAGWNSGGYFWDMYGDPFYTVEHAFLAALCAPVPPGLLKRTAWLKEADLDRVHPRTWCERCRQPNSPFPCAGCSL